MNQTILKIRKRRLKKTDTGNPVYADDYYLETGMDLQSHERRGHLEAHRLHLHL